MNAPVRKVGRTRRDDGPQQGRAQRRREAEAARSRRARPLIIAAVVGAVVVAIVVGLIAFTGRGPGGAGSDDLPPVTGGAGPLASPTGLYVEPNSPAARQRQLWMEEGRTADAEAVTELAVQPVPQWVTAPTGEVGDQVGEYVEAARSAGQRPYLVAYHIPNRDCGSYSGGGATDGADYRAWVREMAAPLRDRDALVVVEPDAVPQELQGCAGDPERAALVADAVSVLKDAGATVYLDAGNPGFVRDVGALAGALRNSGIDRADGFALNVANFYADDVVVEYGRRVSDAVGGKPFVVDTSRNGNGRAEGDTIDGEPAWCNPPGRALGRAPTFDTGDERVAGYLWIKRPGESDGECRGAPAAGRWWSDYALGLATG